MKLLLVEDEKELSKAIKKGLEINMKLILPIMV